MIAAAGDVLSERLRTQSRSDTIELRLRGAGIGEERCAETFAGAVEALLGDLEKRFEPRKSCGGGA
jgi:hypothetical protein